jgi:hypothetical protein
MPRPGMLLKDLIPIKSSAGPSQDEGKGKEVDLMDKGKSERARSVSLTVSEFAGVFHQGKDSAFIYNWIDDNHGDSRSDLDIKETEWLTDQLYFDASEEPE